MSDERVKAMIRELEERYGYRVTKAPCTPEEWRAESVRLHDTIRESLWVDGHKPLPVVMRELEELGKGEKSTEQALLEMVRALNVVVSALLFSAPGGQATPDQWANDHRVSSFHYGQHDHIGPRRIMRGRPVIASCAQHRLAQVQVFNDPESVDPVARCEVCGSDCLVSCSSCPGADAISYVNLYEGDGVRASCTACGLELIPG